MSCDVGKATEGLENELWRRWSDGKFGEWAELIHIVIAELILQHFRHFTYVTTHSPTLPSFYPRHSSFSNPSVASPTSQYILELILQPYPHFTYVTAHSPNLPSLYLCHSSFSNPSFASPTSQLILQPFRRFTYVIAHYPTLPSFYPRHSSFSNPSVASPTSQLILQSFFRFYYVTGFSLTSPGKLPMMSGSFRPPRSPNIIWPSLSSIIMHYGRQWPEMLARPKTSNIQRCSTKGLCAREATLLHTTLRSNAWPSKNDLSLWTWKLLHMSRN